VAVAATATTAITPAMAIRLRTVLSNLRIG
jgi:hypothetical protein